ncbi:MAG: hypothetical protein IID40_03720 [Planctomycetes bacterium]|nr:hypothetical protein [Planctomycetota bacterium]
MVRRFWVVLAGGGVLVALAGCPRQDQGQPPVTTSRPAAAAQPTEAPEPTSTSQPAKTEADPNRVTNRIRSLADPQYGWLRIEALRHGASGAWATGWFIPRRKIVIDTENVDQFFIDLSQLDLDWNQRVILRINGHSSELSRKPRGKLHLRRSPAGSWDVVED